MFPAFFLLAVFLGFSCGRDGKSPTGPSGEETVRPEINKGDYEELPSPGESREYHGITFVSIPSGSFRMGSNFEDDPENPWRGEGYFDNERPVHTVKISAFEMSAYEVTNAQYAAYLREALAAGEITASGSTVTGKTGEWCGEEYIYLNSNFCEISYAGGAFTVESGKEEHPVVEVSWYGAKAFAEHYGLDLPTEAEWEYACRAGTETRFYTGNDLSDDGWTSTALDRAGWYDGNSGAHTHPVGMKEPNAWGLYDMHGNVWEWCNDRYDADYYDVSPSEDPTGPSSGSARVFRGGGWNFIASCCRSAVRYWYNPTNSLFNLGFRLVRRH